MKREVMLSIRGEQTYMGQEPDVIELVTQGYIAPVENGWEISYEESDMTGLAGVLTTFRAENDCITLTRTGALTSEMVFKKGVSHESLYQMEFGALLITVCATKISFDLSMEGGTVDLFYTIDIENTGAGTVKYHLDVSPR